MDEFLIVAWTADELDPKFAKAVERASDAMGAECKASRHGKTLLLTRGATSHLSWGDRLRLAHGNAVRTLSQEYSFDDWIKTIEGGFAALEVDVVTGIMSVARDRFGAAPVYYIERDGCSAVSARLSSICHFFEDRRFDQDALDESIRFRWISGRKALVVGVGLVGAGETRIFNETSDASHGNRWGSLQFRGDGPMDPASQMQLLRSSMEAAIEGALTHSRSPGILLSGGVDSTVIAAIARELRDDVRCFIAAVPGDGVEELRRARYVARKLGLPLEEIQLDESRLAADMQRMTVLLEEPPRNPNNLVLMQLYEAMAARGIDCVLNGDGAEMLLGLADSRRVAQFSSKKAMLEAIPRSWRSALAASLRGLEYPVAWRLARLLSGSVCDFAANLDEIEYPIPLQRVLGKGRGSKPSPTFYPHDDELRRADSTLDFDDALHAYQCLTTLLSSQRRHECFAQHVGVRAFAPFASSDVVAFSEQLPRQLRYTTRSRPILKSLCDEMVGPEIAQWPKLGFSVPWESWLHGPLAGLLGDAGNQLISADVLPSHFAALALETRDPEACWTLLGLAMVQRELGIKLNG